MNEHPRIWSLQEAKAKFSEVVRRAQTEGPQVVTVHGKEVVQIVATDRETVRAPTIEDLIAAFQACPYPEVFDAINQLRTPAPLRNSAIDLG